MKNWILLILGVFLSLPTFAVSSRTETDESILLSYEQFSHLTKAEQLTYVKKMREIMVDVSKAFPGYAQAQSLRSSFYAQMWSLGLSTASAEEYGSPTIVE